MKNYIDMDCHSSTSVSEFLAGISLICLAVNAGIVFLMRPQSLHIRFNPIWNTPRTITNVKSSPVPSSMGQTSDTDSESGDTHGDGSETTVSNEKIAKDEKGGFYSYFT